MPGEKQINMNLNRHINIFQKGIPHHSHCDAEGKKWPSEGNNVCDTDRSSSVSNIVDIQTLHRGALFAPVGCQKIEFLRGALSCCVVD